MINCHELIEFCLDYLEGELPHDEEVGFRRHLAQCTDCVAFFETYRKTPELSREALSAQIPVSVKESVRSFLRLAALTAPLAPPDARAIARLFLTGYAYVLPYPTCTTSISLSPDDRRADATPPAAHVHEPVRAGRSVPGPRAGRQRGRAWRSASRPHGSPTPAWSAWSWSCPERARSSGPAPSRGSTPSARRPTSRACTSSAWRASTRRLIRDYVRERRERLLRLFTPRPIYVSRFGCRFS